MSGNKVWARTKYVAVLLFGNALLAFAVAAFIIPTGIITGGATGIGIMLNNLFDIDTAAAVFVFNVVMLILGGIVLGKKFLTSTLAGSLLYPAFLGIFQRIPQIQTLTQDNLLAALFAGGLVGLSIGMLVRIGSSTGGIDVLNLVLNKWTHISFAFYACISDLVILGGQALFSNIEQILYGILMLLVQTYVIDYVMIMGKAQLQVFVVSPRYEEIRDLLLDKLEAGVTMMQIETGYSREEQRGVICVIPKRKLHDANELVHSVDPNAFITITQIKEVHGEGFSRARGDRFPNDISPMP